LCNNLDMLKAGVDEGAGLSDTLEGRLAVLQVLRVLQVEHADDVHPGASGGVAVAADALGLAARLHLRLDDGLDAVHRHVYHSLRIKQPIQTNSRHKLPAALSLTKHKS